MISSQIEKVLNNFSYDMDSWISLKEITMIVLDQDGRVFPNENLYRYKFDSENEILWVAKGYQKEDGSFVDRHNNITDYQWEDAIEFGRIFGFIRTVDLNSPFILTQNNPIKK